MPAKLLLVRHGETTWNAIHKMQGQANSPLSARGIEQAKALHPVLSCKSFASVDTSDLQRASDTAAYAGFENAKPHTQWREIHVGDWSGEIYSDLQKRFPEEIIAWKNAEFTPPNAESWYDFVARIEGAIASLNDEPQDGTHAVFTHGLVVKAAYCIFTGTHHTQVPIINNCSLSEFDLGAYLQFGPASENCLRFNETLHQTQSRGYI